VTGKIRKLLLLLISELRPGKILGWAQH